LFLIQTSTGNRPYGRFVTIGQLAFFSCETGDAWMLDPSDRLATPLARDGDPEPIEFEETETSFTINWKGSYHIDGSAFVYTDQSSGRVVTIFGYPTAKLPSWASVKILQVKGAREIFAL
jgi:hypothetical protein